MLPIHKLMLTLAVGFVVSGCAVKDTLTRNASFGPAGINAEALPEGYIRVGEENGPPPALAVMQTNPEAGANGTPFTVNAVKVVVPRTLVVSEENGYLPKGDIVWREDPFGDRHAQVQDIVEEAMNRGVADLAGPITVNITVQVVKFHALTKKARYTTGGVHAITFLLAVYDAETGKMTAPVRKVRSDLDALGGTQAIMAEARGVTQRVRISGHLAEVIRQELTYPQGYDSSPRGVIQALNYM